MAVELCVVALGTWPSPCCSGWGFLLPTLFIAPMPVTVIVDDPGYETVLRTLVWTSLLSSLGISFPRSKMRN